MRVRLLYAGEILGVVCWLQEGLEGLHCGIALCERSHRVAGGIALRVGANLVPMGCGAIDRRKEFH